MENKQRGIQPCAEPKQLACLHGLGKLNKEWPTGATGNEPLSAPDVPSAWDPQALTQAQAWKRGSKQLDAATCHQKMIFLHQGSGVCECGQLLKWGDVSGMDGQLGKWGSGGD